MISFFRKLGWLTRRRSKEISSLLNCSSIWKRNRGAPGSRCVRAGRALGGLRRELGNLGLVRKTLGPCGVGRSWKQLGQEPAVWGADHPARNPAFTTLAALSLALVLGRTRRFTAFMDALLMRSLPVADPGSLWS